MNAEKSCLSDPRYGYDFVVATTQASINATMKLFLSEKSEPEVKICYVADAHGVPKQIAYADLVNLAKGSDPFAVPSDADPATNADLKNLLVARFMVAFKAQIGLPPGYADADVPDVVTLQADTASVKFRLMCSEFVVTQLTPVSAYEPAKWFRASQKPGDAWMFTSNVDLRMFATNPSAYGTLPPAVQARIHKLGAAPFSVQQLLFDLDNAALETVPTISGVTQGSPLNYVLQSYFLGVYFTAMQTKGAPILGCTVSQSASDPSTLVLSGLEMEVCPLVDAAGAPIPKPTPAQCNLATLNYLCESDNHALRPAVQFDWNWLDAAGQADGVLAINRNAFRDYFKAKLEPLVRANCYAPTVNVWLSGFLDQNVHYYWKMVGGQAPTVTMPAAGPTVLKFHYENYATSQAGLNGDMGHLTLRPSFDLSVDFVGKTIVVTQHLVVYIYMKVLATPGEGNIIDKTITDTYTLDVDGHGHIKSVITSVPTDNSENPSVNPFLNFFADVKTLISDVKGWMATFVATNFHDLPVQLVQDFVFPGGNTFAFKEVRFSDYQDLTGLITYVDPGTVHRSQLRLDNRARFTESDARKELS